MNTSIRARHDARGFSFVELLVTIVIAGVIFAAMVPVFVSATQKNSADTARLQAANVAQDKIEKIRQLPYSAIAADSVNPDTTPNLYNLIFADAQFGPFTTLDAGSGSRKIYTDYQVTLYPAAATGLASQYKVVTVTAYWIAPPAPVKRVVLQTIVYRQYAGPPLNAFTTNPGIDDNGVMGGTSLASVILSAHVDMSAGATPASVQFKISAYGGQTIASKLVKTSDLTPANGFWYVNSGALAGTFYWTWDCLSAANTVYDFQATAYSTDGFAGNTMHLYPRIDHTLPPAPPGAVIASPGNAKVSLSWGLSGASGLASYEVFRALSATGPWTTPIVTLGFTAPATQPSHDLYRHRRDERHDVLLRRARRHERASAQCPGGLERGHAQRLRRLDASHGAPAACDCDGRACGSHDHADVGRLHRPWFAQQRHQAVRDLAQR